MASDALKAFQSSAAYYDALFDLHARLEREAPLLRHVLEEAPGRRVVDLACGTGPHARFYAEAGCEVTAFDVSPEMVAYARKGAPETAHFAVGDMRQLSGGPWDLALCLGNSLSLLPVMEDIEVTLRHVRACLAPGGVFVTQVLNYEHPETKEPQHRIARKQVDGTEVIAVKSLVPHRTHTLLSLTFFAAQEGRYTSIAESAVLLHPTLPLMEVLARQTGFEVMARYGAFDQSPFDPETSGNLILVLRRSEEPA